MSLFDPTAKLFAFPPLPDLPINQPALGDNIAWSFDESADYDYWSNFESGFDDSWTWDERKEAAWKNSKGQANSIVITVKPSEHSDPEKSSRQDGDALKTSPDEDHDEEPEAALAADSDEQSASLTRPEWKFSDWANELPETMDFCAATDFGAPQPWDGVLGSDPAQNIHDTHFDNALFSGDEMIKDYNFGNGPLIGSEVFAAGEPEAFVTPCDTELDAISQFPTSDMFKQQIQEPAEVNHDRWKYLEKDLMQALGAEFSGQAQLGLLEAAQLPPSPSGISTLQYLPSPDHEMLDHDSSSPDAILTDEATPNTDYDGNRLVSCSTCQKIVKRRKLHDHMRWHVKSFGCESCDKSFASEKDLRRHERQHTGDKPFKCEVLGCKYARTGFARLDNLKRHVKKLHGDGVS